MRAGTAWWYRQHAKRDAVLPVLEQEAQAARRGLWVDASPVAPWDWRKGEGALTSNSSNTIAATHIMGLQNETTFVLLGIRTFWYLNTNMNSRGAGSDTLDKQRADLYFRREQVNTAIEALERLQGQRELRRPMGLANRSAGCSDGLSRQRQAKPA
ncbi:MAG: hypothetical protein ABI759_24180 [Candidatus Solibacter sp.]